MAVYFFQEQGGERLIKIGKSSNVIARLHQIQLGHSYDVRVLGFIEGDGREERLLHAIFADYRQHGEWFKPCDILTGFIARNAMPLDAYKVLPPEKPPRVNGSYVNPIGIRLIEEYGIENLIGLDSTDWYATIQPLRERLAVLAPYSRENALLQIKKAFRYVSGTDAPSGAR